MEATAIYDGGSSSNKIKAASGGGNQEPKTNPLLASIEALTCTEKDGVGSDSGDKGKGLEETNGYIADGNNGSNVGWRETKWKKGRSPNKQLSRVDPSERMRDWAVTS